LCQKALPCILRSSGAPQFLAFSQVQRSDIPKGCNPMPTPKFRVLCTEDDADTRDLIVVMLNGNDCEVVTSASSSESVHLARTQHFDLYLLDNWLPGSSGIELCKELRMFDSKTPILFYSGAAYDKDKKQAQECGAQAYLTKPADSDELVAEVLRLINASRSSSHPNSAQR
jgi:DNA-binding response OmpR family regulator